MAVTEATETDLIPVLDLQPLLDGDADGIAQLGEELKAALEDVGFFFIVNHGVPWSQIQGI